MLSEQRLSEIRARLKAATPGPWAEHDEVPRVPVSLSVDPNMSLLGLDLDGYARMDSQEDAEFIIHAPTDIADLLAEVERLRAHGVEVAGER